MTAEWENMLLSGHKTSSSSRSIDQSNVWFHGKGQFLLSADKVENSEEDIFGYSAYLFNELSETASMPDHQHTLKPSFPVMLLRIVQPVSSHLSGDRYIIDSMTIAVLFLSSSYGIEDTKRFNLPCVPSDPGEKDFPIAGFCSTHFPVCVCIATNTNKIAKIFIRWSARNWFMSRMPYTWATICGTI